MEIIETPLKDCFIIKNNVIGDNRGYFFESFNHRQFSSLTGWEGQFVQDNQSCSKFGVVRGLHFQRGDSAQAKLVRVLQGKVLDVAVDLRPHSSSFGKWFAVELSDDNATQFFVPRGFAHGFSVLSESATFFYKCDSYYHKESEGAIHPYDDFLNIDWKIAPTDALLSEKDKAAGSWQDFLNNL